MGASKKRPGAMLNEERQPKKVQQPKTLLVCTMQTLLKSSQTLEYTTVQINEGEYVSSITIPDITHLGYFISQTFTGAPASSEKAAENEAASAALQVLGNVAEEVKNERARADDRTGMPGPNGEDETQGKWLLCKGK